MINPYLINSESRTFIREYNESSAKYEFYTCTILDVLSQEMGEVSSDYYYDPKYNAKYVETSTILSPVSIPTISMVGRIPRDFASQIYNLSTKRALANVQLHFGRCYNPTIFNDFDEALILEDVRVVSYSTDRLGSISRDENAIINETAGLSVGRWYTIHKLAYSNIGTRIFNDGFVLLSLDVLDCDECDNNDTCTIFALARHLMNPLTTPFRIYITENTGKSWRYVELPFDVYEPTLIHAKFTTISVFSDYVYLHIRTETGFDSESRIFSMPTQDLLRNIGEWNIAAVNGVTDNLPSSDRIVKFKNKYYAPYVEDITYLSSVYSRIVNFGTVVGSNFNISYVPKTNKVISEGMYTDTPLYMYNYKDQILFTGIFIGVPNLDNDPRKLYIAYTKDGNNWIEVPIMVDGQQATGTGSQHIHILPINEKHWLVTVQNSTSTNKAYVTVNGGKTWKLITAAFKGSGFVATYAPTESIIFSEQYRSYDGGITAAQLPDNKSDIEYSTVVSSFPSLHGDSYAKCFGCKNNPNLMITYGADGVHLFN